VDPLESVTADHVNVPNVHQVTNYKTLDQPKSVLLAMLVSTQVKTPISFVQLVQTTPILHNLVQLSALVVLVVPKRTQLLVSSAIQDNTPPLKVLVKIVQSTNIPLIQEPVVAMNAVQVPKLLSTGTTANYVYRVNSHRTLDNVCLVL